MKISLSLLIGVCIGLSLSSVLYFSFFSPPIDANTAWLKEKHERDLAMASKSIIARKSKVLNGTDAYLQIAKKVLQSLPEKYKPDPKWVETCNFPDISIIHAPKAGTSQLYNILSKHPDAKGFHSSKEYCMDRGGKLNYDSPNESLFSSLFRFHLKNMNQTLQSRPKTTVHGCLNHKETLLHELYIQSLFQANETLRSIWNRKRYIIVFRDPADLLYSHFNFWTINGFDSVTKSKERINDWASAKLDYRSPELFHEVILSGNRTIIGTSFFDSIRRFYNLGQTYIEMVGRDRILFMKNEDMLPDTVDREDGLLDQLSKFTNLTYAKFPLKIVHSKTNCNNIETSRGANELCQNLTSTDEGYAVSGNRPMLPETRRLIYIIFSDECKLWAEHFGIVYDDCIQALKRL